MKIITVLTDFGYQDPYVGIMKGVMLNINPDLNIVDISHNVPSFSIRHAAFSVFSYYKYFPEDTIHLIVVDPGVGSKRKAIGARIDNRYFILPDNGIITYIWYYGKEKEAYVIENEKYFLKPVSNTFHGRDIFSPAASYLSRGIALKEFGPLLDKPILFSFYAPKKYDNRIEGEVIYTDKFGNVITNISREMLPTNKAFCVEIKNEKICKFVRFYGEAKEGERVSIVGSTGLLELSQNQESLKTSLNIRIGDKVKIVF